MAAADHSGAADDEVSAATEDHDSALQDSSSTAQLHADADDVDNAENQSASVAPLNGRVSSSLNSVAGGGGGGGGVLLGRSTRTPPAVTPADAAPVVTMHDIRKFVFQASARADKRVTGGLAAHTFTSQTFISSFAVGLAVGSILAIVIKLLTEIGSRALLYHR